MSYQVLARKWRPKSFGTLVGQEHVVRALSHALATGRLHHAYLFTGTRGVGKTTISRILAKALNCETGVTAEPCGQCGACLAIDADRFPDYVEMDAASNRGVEDMAALLDKAVYAPVQGRYKVYMIDEVHMLTGHAFNAMLKTLEEPPEHVKFILATTDPQKIPVTVLSRCLQFNLKQMPPGHIVDHLGRLLQAEGVPFEPGALRHIAKAAAGSMRDALSLLDQAIAHGAGAVAEEQVSQMLGTVGDDHLYAALDALATGDVAALLAVADAIEARSLSFDAALQTLASVLHRIALSQFAPGAVADEAERQRLAPYAGAFGAEYLQLAYQIVIHGRDELALAPDDYAGFTMTLLRLHAFRPEQPAPLDGPTAVGGGGGGARPLPPPVGVSATRSVPSAPAVEQVASVAKVVEASGSVPGDSVPDTPRGDIPPWESLPPQAGDDAWHGGEIDAEAACGIDGPPDRQPALTKTAPVLHDSAPVLPGDAVALPKNAAAPSETVPAASVDAAFAAGDWRGAVRALGLGGLVRELAQHCEWVGYGGGHGDDVLKLRLSDTHRHLLEASRAERLQEQIAAALGKPLRLRIDLGAIAGETPAQRDEVERRARHATAVAALECDPVVRELIERFDATLVEASVKPL